MGSSRVGLWERAASSADYTSAAGGLRIGALLSAEARLLSGTEPTGYSQRQMAYTSEQAREKLLADVADAIGQLAFALACVSEAYEALDERSAEWLEAALFRPIQGAYGRAKRAHTEFAALHGQAARAFQSPSPGLHSRDPKVYIERAVEATERADHVIAELQDSMLPVEVGDEELRAGLSATRELISAVPARGRQLLRTFGR